MVFYFPFTGEEDLFKCHASTYSLSGYPDISISRGFISLRYEYSLNEMQSENAKDSALKKLERDIKNIRDGISYANKDVESYNISLKKQALQLLEEKKRKVKSFFSVANMFEVPDKKSAYAETHVSLQRKIVPIAHEYKNEDIYSISDAKHVLNGKNTVYIRFNSISGTFVKDYEIQLIDGLGRKTYTEHPDTEVDIIAIQLNPQCLINDSSIWVR